VDKPWNALWMRCGGMPRVRYLFHDSNVVTAIESSLETQNGTLPHRSEPARFSELAFDAAGAAQSAQVRATPPRVREPRGPRRGVHCVSHAAPPDVAERRGRNARMNAANRRSVASFDGCVVYTASA
jgi:hypothetical protein